jgi:hypothetical protein
MRVWRMVQFKVAWKMAAHAQELLVSLFSWLGQLSTEMQ